MGCDRKRRDDVFIVYRYAECFSQRQNITVAAVLREPKIRLFHNLAWPGLGRYCSHFSLLTVRVSHAVNDVDPLAAPNQRVVASRAAFQVVAKQNSLKRQRTSEKARVYNKAHKSAVATRMKKVCIAARSCTQPTVYVNSAWHRTGVQSRSRDGN